MGCSPAAGNTPCRSFALGGNLRVGQGCAGAKRGAPSAPFEATRRHPSEQDPQKKIMNPVTSLSGSHLSTYNRIFQHPVTHNLDWRAVHNLLAHLGQLVEEPNGNLKVTRNGQSLVLHPPRTKDVAEIDEVMTLRHFLVRSSDAPTTEEDAKPQWLLIVDHQHVRIFRCDQVGADSQAILPHAPSEYFRHAHNSKDFSRGREKPDPNSFFGPVAEALKMGGPILIFGSGTGTSSEMDQLILWAKIHDRDMAARIIASVVVDEHHVTDGQLVARARKMFSASRDPVASI
jgi:hypothetical protein